MSTAPHPCRRWFLLRLRKKPSNTVLAQSLLAILAIFQVLLSLATKRSSNTGGYVYRLLLDTTHHPSKYSPKPMAVALTNDRSTKVERLELDRSVQLQENWTAVIAPSTADSESGSSSDDGLDHREECVPMYSWQTEFYPTCNNMHELSFTGMVPKDQSRLIDHGLHRDVWEVQEDDNKSWALKTLRYNTYFDKWHEQGQIIDAIISERLTYSPHVADIYNFCGFSALYDFASKGTLQDHYPKLAREERLRAAAHASRALAQVHAEGGGDESAIVHADIAVRQFVYLDGQYKLNDFNTACLMKWNTETGDRCGHILNKPYDKNRAPEEMFHETNYVDEKIDVYSLGNIFYKLLMNERKYNDIHTPEAQELIMAGDIPRLPDDMENSTDVVISSLKRAMHMCLILDPKKRATALEVADYLEKQLHKMEQQEGKDDGGDEPQRRNLRTRVEHKDT